MAAATAAGFPLLAWEMSCWSLFSWLINESLLSSKLSIFFLYTEFSLWRFSTFFSRASMYSFFFLRLSWAEILFLILRRIFFKDFSSALVRGSRVGMGYPSANRVRFSSSVSNNIPVDPLGWLLMSDVWMGCLIDVPGGGETRSRLLICDDWRLDGEEGWWSFPSLSLVVEDGGVGGREKPGSTLMLSFGKTLCCCRTLFLETSIVGCFSKLCGWLLVWAMVLCSW